MTHDTPANTDPGACSAHGCPLLGSIDTSGGGRFLCSAHAWVPMAKWQTVTAELRRHQWMLDHMADLRRIGVHTRWRPLAVAFWAGHDPEVMQPKAGESRETYLYRLHLDLMWRVGAREQRPEPMVSSASESTGARSRPEIRSAFVAARRSMTETGATDPHDERLAEAKVQAAQRVAAYGQGVQA